MAGYAHPSAVVHRQTDFNRGYAAGLKAAPPPPPAAATPADTATNPDFQRLADAVTALYGAGTNPSIAPTPVLVDPTQQAAPAAGAGGPGGTRFLVGLAVLAAVGYLGYRWWTRRKKGRTA